LTKRLPSVRPQEVVRALEGAGWEVARQKGSHLSLKKEGVAFLVTVPSTGEMCPGEPCGA